MADVEASATPPPRILVAGIGYPFLHDWSVGTRVAADLAQREWPAGVEVDDWSFGPIDAVFKLRGAQPPYQRVIFFGCVNRGRPPGTVVRRQWSAADMPSDEELQERIGESLSGVISLDNVVFICAGFHALPEDVVLLEVEPLEESWGDGYSPAVEKAIPELIGLIEREVELKPFAGGVRSRGAA
ncbi:MAG: hypothetical protein NVSMB29_12660 [Candidatus Dormibacteria bacterium]